MSSIGGLASCQSLNCNTLIADEIDVVNTGKNINMTKDGVIRWSIGLDSNNNFVLQNEVADVGASIIADNDTGVVQLLGGGSGDTPALIDLTDVDTNNISNNDLMYYDSADSKFKFSNNITINLLDTAFLTHVNAFQIFANSNTLGVQFDANLVTGKDAYGNLQDISLGQNVNIIGAFILPG